MNKRIRLASAVSNELAQVADFGYSKASTGTPSLWADFEFVDLRGDNDESVYIRHFWYLTEKTIEFVMRDLATLGYHGNIFALSEAAPGAGIQGKQASLVCEMEPSNKNDGKMYAKVRYINEPGSTGGGAGMEPLEKGELKTLEAKLAQACKLAKAKREKAGPAKTAKSPEPALSGAADKPAVDSKGEKIPF